MTVALFPAQFKTTIGALAKGIANAADGGAVEMVDMDDSVNDTELLQASDTVVVWQLHAVNPMPYDPMYQFSISVGVKTGDDRGNMRMLKLLGDIQAKFAAGAEMPVYDYTTTTPPVAPVGSLIVVAISMDQYQFDKTVGYRMYGIEGKALRFP